MICPKCKKPGALSLKQESVGTANEIHFACECPSGCGIVMWHKTVLSPPGSSPAQLGPSKPCSADCPQHNLV
jgi:hypothetical protein